MTALYPYQKRGAIQLQKWDGRALLASEMGLGKTIQFLSWLQTTQAYPAIAVCPASLKWNWQREAAIHYGINSQVLEGRLPPRRWKPQAGLVIINYDILPGWIDSLLDMEPRTLAIDEAHFCKSSTSQRTQLCRELAKECEHVIGMTGTPIVNEPSEIWPVLNMIRPDVYDAFFPFAHTYCRPRRTPWGWRYKGSRNEAKLHRILTKQVMIRHRKADVLKDLPEKTRIVIPMDITDPKQYREAERDIVRWLRKHKPSKANRAARAKRLVQFGYLKRLAAELKMKSVLEWTRNFLASGEKLILFAVHKRIIKELHKEFRNSVVIDGSTTGRKRQQAIDQFTRDSKTPLMIGNLQAAGVGWNGTAASAVALAEMGWTPGEHSQAEDRVHRIGQHDGARAFYLIARGTIEERLCEIIQEKQQILDSVIDGGQSNNSVNILDLLERTITR